MSSSPNALPPVMAFAQVQGKAAKRQRAAQLLEAVIQEEVEPRLAINRWPETLDEPVDPSLECAFQALWHFEADEDKQQSEIFYMDAQLELLRQMAQFLKEGKDLPAYMLRMYSPQNKVRFFYLIPPWEEGKRLLRQYGQEVKETWQAAWQLCVGNFKR